MLVQVPATPVRTASIVDIVRNGAAHAECALAITQPRRRPARTAVRNPSLLRVGSRAPSVMNPSIRVVVLRGIDMTTVFSRIVVVCFCFWPLFAYAKNKPDREVVEIKCLVPVEKMGEFSKRLRLDSRVPLKRTVCFYDTDALSLFQHNPTVILRSRYDSSFETDTTVKVRDGTLQIEAAQCDFDKVLGKERMLSCSLTDTNQEEKQIRNANAGGNVKKIFSREQEKTVKTAFGKIDWQELRPYGPVKGILVWKRIKLPGRPDLTVERWRLPHRSGKPARVLLEVSAKVRIAEEARVAKWVADLVGISDRGIDQQSETKTRIVLEHFR